MESIENEIARKICEHLGIPYPSEDAVQMRQIIKEIIDRRISKARPDGTV